MYLPSGTELQQLHAFLRVFYMRGQHLAIEIPPSCVPGIVYLFFILLTVVGIALLFWRYTQTEHILPPPPPPPLPPLPSPPRLLLDPAIVLQHFKNIGLEAENTCFKNAAAQAAEFMYDSDWCEKLRNLVVHMNCISANDAVALC